ncbi:MAG: SDR family oxidoreductase [Betaproteobacteria bacterium]|jgi:NAD(P)-dependent dehydrogenase (short-subunit alcohol dehydrogenase family)
MQKKIILITGASRGIGASIAELAGSKDYFVVVNYAKNISEANNVVAKIKAAGGDGCAIQADCGIEADIVRLFKEVDKLGKLDTVVANAGIVGGEVHITEVSTAQLSEVFGINVIGLMLTTREAVKRMSTKLGGTGGKIILMSSAASRTGGIAKETHYAASKGAVDSFTLALAKEVGMDGIRVAALRPGLIRTEIHNAHGGIPVIEKWASGVPLGRVGTPSEVAQTVMWLCSDDASYIHGALIDVSGGR